MCSVSLAQHKLQCHGLWSKLMNQKYILNNVSFNRNTQNKKQENSALHNGIFAYPTIHYTSAGYYEDCGMEPVHHLWPAMA